MIRYYLEFFSGRVRMEGEDSYGTVSEAMKALADSSREYDSASLVVRIELPESSDKSSHLVESSQEFLHSAYGNLYQSELEQLVDWSGFDLSECKCGRPVISIGDGLPHCKFCVEEDSGG